MNKLEIYVLAYLLGSIPSAFIAAKVFAGKDIRKIGSGNVGTMNTLRNVGIMPGIVTFVTDFGKGAAAAWLACNINQPYTILYTVILLLMLGHNWSIILKFKGGKGLAVTAGALTIINFKLGLIVYTVIGIFTLLFKNSDLACVIGFLLYPFLLLIFYNNFQIFIIGLVHFLLVFVRHYPELKQDRFTTP